MEKYDQFPDIREKLNRFWLIPMKLIFFFGGKKALKAPTRFIMP